MNNYKIHSANNAWIEILTDIRQFGSPVISRGMETSEILFNEQIFDMNQPICYHQLRRLNYAFSAAEAYFIAHGDNRVANLAQYNKNITAFSDDGLIFNGAYGPPFNNQVDYVVNKLLSDLTTRQAILTIWKPNPSDSRDIMCTIALQFLVRNERMFTKVTMRSSDCWLGIPYDFFNFTIMTLRILTLLNTKLQYKSDHRSIELGNMHWSAGSSHMYSSDLLKVNKLLSEGPVDKEPSAVPIRAYSDWAFVVDSLQACMNKDENAIVANNLWRIRP